LEKGPCKLLALIEFKGGRLPEDCSFRDANGLRANAAARDPG